MSKLKIKTWHGVLIGLIIFTSTIIGLIFLIQRDNRLKQFRCDVGFGTCRVKIDWPEEQLREHYEKAFYTQGYTQGDYKSLAEFIVINKKRSLKALKKLQKKHNLTKEEEENLKYIKKRLDYLDRLAKIIDDLR